MVSRKSSCEAIANGEQFLLVASVRWRAEQRGKKRANRETLMNGRASSLSGSAAAYAQSTINLIEGPGSRETASTSRANNYP